MHLDFCIHPSVKIIFHIKRKVSKYIFKSSSTLAAIFKSLGLRELICPRTAAAAARSSSTRQDSGGVCSSGTSHPLLA